MIGQRITVYRVASVEAWVWLAQHVPHGTAEAIWRVVEDRSGDDRVKIGLDNDAWSHAFAVAQRIGIGGEFEPGRDPHPS